MGGYGSGWQGASKTLVEHCTRLEMTSLHQQGVAYGKHCSGPGPGPNGLIVRFTLSRDTLVLEYLAQNRRHSIAVPIVTTTPYYGGSRSWFLCPKCSRRCAVLYIHAGNSRFSCRLCQRLQYQSTRIVKPGSQKELAVMARALASFDARMSKRRAIVDRLLTQDRGRMLS